MTGDICDFNVLILLFEEVWKKELQVNWGLPSTKGKNKEKLCSKDWYLYIFVLVWGLEMSLLWTEKYLILVCVGYICDVIKQNQSEVGNIDFEI